MPALTPADVHNSPSRTNSERPSTATPGQASASSAAWRQCVATVLSFARPRRAIKNDPVQIPTTRRARPARAHSPGVAGLQLQLPNARPARNDERVDRQIHFDVDRARNQKTAFDSHRLIFQANRRQRVAVRLKRIRCVKCGVGTGEIQKLHAVGHKQGDIQRALAHASGDSRKRVLAKRQRSDNFCQAPVSVWRTRDKHTVSAHPSCRSRLSFCAYGVLITISLISVMSSMAKRTPSRPIPESLTPP